MYLSKIDKYVPSQVQPPCSKGKKKKKKKWPLPNHDTYEEAPPWLLMNSSL